MPETRMRRLPRISRSGSCKSVSAATRSCRASRQPACTTCPRRCWAATTMRSPRSPAPISRPSIARRRPTSQEPSPCCRKQPRRSRCAFAGRWTLSREPRAHDFYLNDIFICDYLIARKPLGPIGRAMQTPIIDTHLHLVYRGKLSYPWLADVPPLDRDFSYETYALEARRCGVTDALHMEVDVAPGDIEAETRNVEELARRPQSLLRGAISACRPEEDGFPAFLDRQIANPFVKGFRRVLHVVPDDLSEGATFRANIKRLAGASRPFDLCVRPDQIDKAIALADLAPSVQFVLDHCGVPAIKDRAEHPWREHIAEIARRPNVAVKISGVVAYE